MAVNSKDIEILWKQYSEDGVNKGISVAQFFESNGVPYHTFEKWYKKKFSKNGIVDCVVRGTPDATIQVPDEDGRDDSRTEKKKEVYVSYVNIGLSEWQGDRFLVTVRHVTWFMYPKYAELGRALNQSVAEVAWLKHQGLSVLLTLHVGVHGEASGIPKHWQFPSVPW